MHFILAYPIRDGSCTGRAFLQGVLDRATRPCFDPCHRCAYDVAGFTVRLIFHGVEVHRAKMAAAHRAREARDVVHFLHHHQSVFLADDFMIAPTAHALRTRKDCRSIRRCATYQRSSRREYSSVGRVWRGLSRGRSRCVPRMASESIGKRQVAD